MALKLSWRPFQPSQPAQKLPLLAVLYLLAPVALWMAGGDLPALTPEFLTMMGIGLLLGSFSLSAMYGIQLWAGWLRLAGCLDLKLAPVLLGLALWVGWTEELVFRGFLQDQLEQRLSVWGAAICISLFFAVLHGLWEGSAVLPQLLGLWLMGMVLVLARQADAGSLGLAWGLHSGWVWAIGILDGAKLRTSGRLPVWVTGNDSPLASLIGVLFLLATAAGLWWLKARAG